MIKKVDAKKMLDITTITLCEEDVKMIEKIVETIQDYAMETGQIAEDGGTAEPLISQIRWLRSLYDFELYSNL